MALPLLLVSLLCPAMALDNGLVPVPPQGWLAWERFRCNTDCINDPENCISELLFQRMADLMVVDGWLAAGYTYIIMDDCWMAPTRGSDGRLSADPVRFPSGVPALAAYVHRLGLKLGIYGDLGSRTCAGYPGSQGHLAQDAQTFADWGVHWVKLDGCHSDFAAMDAGYAEFGAALLATGRPMVYQCEGPLYQANHGISPNYTAARETCNLWRNHRDVQDNWPSVLDIADFYGDDTADFLHLAGPGGWNDPDMLVIGNFGLSYDQSQAQLALWTMFAAPLLMSLDMRAIRPEYTALLQHRGVLKVATDPLGKAGRRVRRREHVDFFTRPTHPLWRGHTSQAVLILNRWASDKRGPRPILVTFTPQFLGLRWTSGYRVNDIYGGTELGVIQPMDNLTVQVNPTGVSFLRFDLVQEKEENEENWEKDEEEGMGECWILYP